MPIRPSVPRCALRSPTKLRRPRAGRTARRGLAALAGCAAFAAAAGPASAAELLTNGGFESGTFSGWTTTQLTSPYTPWVIATSSDTGGMSLATPQEGTYDAMNGFDGNGPGHFTLSQTVSIPTGSTVLSWRDRIQYSIFGSQARLLEVKVVDPVTEGVLATLYTFTTGDNSGFDTGWQSHSFDLSSFGGQTVKLLFDETIPENYSGPAQIEFDAISVMTLLSASPTSLPFGSQDIADGPTATQESTLTNATGGTVALTGLTLGGDDPTAFSLRAGEAGDCTSATILAAGEACDVGVNFDPSAVGAKTATVTFDSNEPDVTVALTGTATRRELTLDPSALALGSRDVDDGPTDAEAATITNSSTEPVTLSALTLSGDAAQFERLSGETGDCTATTVLAAGETCNVRVRFDPTSQGAQAATLTVTSNADDLTLALTGSALQTELTASPATLDLGTRDIGAGPTAGQSSIVTNSGTELVTLSALTLSGDAAEFERLSGETGDCTATTVLAAGETCNVRVRFDPASTGARTAAVAVASDAAEIAVALHGSGTQAGTVADTPAPAGPGPAAAGFRLPAKLSLLRATIDRRDRVLDVLAKITSNASGRVNIELHAAGQRYRFTAPIDPATASVRFRRRIPAAQARLGTGIVTITYSGDSDTRPQTVRLRAASDHPVLLLGRPQIVNGRITASGTVDSSAHGVVRLQLEYDRGGDTALVRFRAAIDNGRWSLDEPLSATTAAEIASRRGTVHSYTLFTGFMAQRMRGEMRSFQVLGNR